MLCRCEVIVCDIGSSGVFFFFKLFEFGNVFICTSNLMFLFAELVLKVSSRYW